MRSSALTGVIFGLALIGGKHSYGSSLAPQVKVEETAAGSFLTDHQGLTLYTYEHDSKPNESSCTNKCAASWPPLPAPPDAQPLGDWSPIKRPDGSQQWAYKGRPLYRYVKDTNPGAALGNGIDGAWHLVFEPILMPVGLSIQLAFSGRVLADSDGMTAYAYTKDSPGRSNCMDACLQSWTPVAAPALANEVGVWSVVVRDDGRRQWAYKKQALYTFVGDYKAGETKGDGVEKAWHAIVLLPNPPPPPDITIHPSDKGEVYADARGMTLYGEPDDIDRIKKEICDEKCFRVNMKPLIAGRGAQPAGDWSLVKREDGTQQWSYKGKALYTFVGDRGPGEISGDEFGNGKSAPGGGFRALTISGE